MSDKKTFHYEGKNATVTWEGSLCIHIGECGRKTAMVPARCFRG